MQLWAEAAELLAEEGRSDARIMGRHLACVVRTTNMAAAARVCAQHQQHW